MPRVATPSRRAAPVPDHSGCILLDAPRTMGKRQFHAATVRIAKGCLNRPVIPRQCVAAILRRMCSPAVIGGWRGGWFHAVQLARHSTFTAESGSTNRAME